jgi:hypothetical protein
VGDAAGVAEAGGSAVDAVHSNLVLAISKGSLVTTASAPIAP